MTRSIEVISPWVYRISNFLSEQELASCIENLQKVELFPQKNPGQFNFWVWLYPSKDAQGSKDLVASIFREAFTVVQTLFENFLQRKLSLLTQVCVFELKHGQSIAIHNDDHSYLQGVFHTRTTSEVDWGVLQFIKDGRVYLSITPQRNTAIIFDAMLMHSVSVNNSSLTRYSVSFCLNPEEVSIAQEEKFLQKQMKC